MSLVNNHSTKKCSQSTTIFCDKEANKIIIDVICLSWTIQYSFTVNKYLGEYNNRKLFSLNNLYPFYTVQYVQQLFMKVTWKQVFCIGFGIRPQNKHKKSSRTWRQPASVEVSLTIQKTGAHTTHTLHTDTQGCIQSQVP